MKKAVRSGKRAVKSRYGIGKNRKLNTGRIAKDVARLAMMINAEKKTFSITGQNELALVGVGQVSANSTGARIFDVTPLITQGATAESRNGDSLKLVSAYFQFMIAQQTAGQVANKASIELWHYNGGAPIAVGDALASIYQPTVFSTVIDYQSARNIDKMGDWRLARKMIVSLEGEQVAGTKTCKYVNMPLKFNRGKGHHVRYSGSTISNNPLTDLANGRSQLFLVYRVESGNKSATVSTLNVPITSITTGLEISTSYTMYYYDN